MTRRRVSNPLALAVLGTLIERPMHPYEISTTLRERGKETSIKLNYGSLYSVVESLQNFKTTTNPEMIDRSNFEPAIGHAHGRRWRKVFNLSGFRLCQRSVSRRDGGDFGHPPFSRTPDKEAASSLAEWPLS